MYKLFVEVWECKKIGIFWFFIFLNINKIINISAVFIYSEVFDRKFFNFFLYKIENISVYIIRSFEKMFKKISVWIFFKVFIIFFFIFSIYKNLKIIRDKNIFLKL